MSTKANLHRETLKAALRVIQTVETLDQARIQLARMLNVFDKLEKTGILGDAAVREAEKRLSTSVAPKTSSADKQPIRRRGPGRDGPA
jgi:methyl coenzyme M reductase alpha subunit